MPEVLINILGFKFALSAPYVSGHVCTAAEAQALNKMLVRGTSKGLHKVLTGELDKVKKRSLPLDGETRALIARAGEEHISEFREGFAQGHDVVRATKVESARIARQLLEAQLNHEGRSRMT